MIEWKELKVNLKLKLRGRRGSKAGSMPKDTGTTITVKELKEDLFFDEDDFQYLNVCLGDFDLVVSSLPTDRPLTYDETQMLKKGDVVRCWYGGNLIIKTVSNGNIAFENETRKWGLDLKEKNTCGSVYFISHGKEEKKEEVKGGFKSVTFNGIPIHSGSEQKECLYGCDVAQEPMFDPMKKHIEEHRKFLLCSTKDTKSVSQIIYGR
jgi:hypothetical protein